MTLAAAHQICTRGERAAGGKVPFFLWCFFMRACLTPAPLFFFLQKAPPPHAALRPPLPTFGPRVRRFLLACLRIACLAQLFGLVCTSACKMAWRASRGTHPRPGEGERALSGLLPRARVPQTVTNRISRSAASRCAAHGRPAGSWPQKKKKTSSCATRITHAGSSPQPTPPPSSFH